MHGFVWVGVALPIAWAVLMMSLMSWSTAFIGGSAPVLTVGGVILRLHRAR